MADNGVFATVAVFGDERDANAAYDEVKRLHDTGLIGAFDAAVVSRDGDGSLRVRKRETPTRTGAWSGLAAGALVGIAFPPALLPLAAAVGAGLGAITGHLWRGLSRDDVREIGRTLDGGQSALVVIGRTRLEETLRKATERATRRIERQIDADARAFREAVDEAIDDARRTALTTV